MGENGEMDDFTQYFNGDSDSEEEATYYERSVKSDIESMILAFSFGVHGCHIFQEEEGLFQIKGQILDDGCARYTVDDRHSFERRYGELTYSLSAVQEKFSPAAGRSGVGEEVLGIGFLENPRDGVMYGMSAKYAEDSAPGDPVIQVALMTSGEPEEHYIHVNQVNPENATEIEMFALCNYMDATGQGTDEKFGTWQTLNYFRQNAGYNGYFKLSSRTDVCDTLRQDWLAMVIRMNADYERAGLERQAGDGSALVQMLSGGKERTREGKNGREEHGVGSVKDGMPVQSVEETTLHAVVDDGVFLTNETSQCSYPPERREEEEIHYIVCYTQDGIVCKRAGDRCAVWKMPFVNAGDYGRVMNFLQNFGFDENLRFACHEIFWQDYLSGNMDVNGFLTFFARAENGIPNYFIITEDGIYVDKENLKYQKYFAHDSIADPQSQLPYFVDNFLENPSKHVQWQENYQRWKREFVSLSEEVVSRRVG